MMTGDSIAAVASSPGTADRAVVRLSGPLDPVSPLVRPFPVERGVSRVQLDLGGTRLPCLAIRYIAPSSYTGEDALELIVPGGQAVVSRVLRVLLACEGVRHAGSGEFSARAYLAGRLSLDEARGIEAVITASNAAQLAAADRLLSGALGRAARGWAQSVARLLALVEAGIDFTDQEDVTAIEPERLAGELGALAADITGELGAARGSQRSSGVPRVVLVGPPSAGKSTLFNALLGRERSVTDSEPGTTRDAIVEPVSLQGGVEIELVDLPGLDASAGAELARAQIERADLRLVCDEFAQFGPGADERTLHVATKADRAHEPAKPGVLRVCSITGEGLDALRAAIAERARASLGDDGSLPISVAGRLRAALDAVETASELAGGDAELVADRLRAALDELGAVTGRVDPDAVLGLVFSSFCVGK